MAAGVETRLLSMDIVAFMDFRESETVPLKSNRYPNRIVSDILVLV